MKLINTLNSQLLVEFRGDETLIYNKFLEQEMRTVGIAVPHGLRGLYHGKDNILLDDLDFQRAFKEVYYLMAMDHEKFRWKNY